MFVVSRLSKLSCLRQRVPDGDPGIGNRKNIVRSWDYTHIGLDIPIIFLFYSVYSFDIPTVFLRFLTWSPESIPFV